MCCCCLLLCASESVPRTCTKHTLSHSFAVLYVMTCICHVYISVVVLQCNAMQFHAMSHHDNHLHTRATTTTTIDNTSGLALGSTVHGHFQCHPCRFDIWSPVLQSTHHQDHHCPVLLHLHSGLAAVDRLVAPVPPGLLHIQPDAITH